MLLKCYDKIIKIFNLNINGAPSNNTAPANSSDKIVKNFMFEINSTAQYYSRKYGIKVIKKIYKLLIIKYNY